MKKLDLIKGGPLNKLNKIFIVTKAHIFDPKVTQHPKQHEGILKMEEHHTKIGNHFYEVFKNSYPNTYSTTLSQFSNEMTQEDLEKSQVLTVGGDGTFISAANKMANNNSYILGINPDTDSSQGFLCGYDIKVVFKIF